MPPPFTFTPEMWQYASRLASQAAANSLPSTGNPTADAAIRSAVVSATAQGVSALAPHPDQPAHHVFGLPSTGAPPPPTNPRPKQARRTDTQNTTHPRSQRRWKTGLPSEWQKVEKPVKGSNKRASGTMTTYKSKSKKVRRLNDKFDQTYRITQFLCNPNNCYDETNKVIKNRDSVILEGSLNKHYKMLLFNATPCVKPDVYSVGNNQVPFDQPGWIFSTLADNSGLRKGYTDEQSGAKVNIGANTGASSDARTICTISGIPYSASSKEYQTPNQVFKGVNLNFEIELLNLNQNAEFFCKVVRYKKPLAENFDFSDKGTFGDAQRAAYNEITKHLLNNEKTDRENFDTIFLFQRKVKPPPTGGPLRRIKINKKIKTNYLRTSTYMHTDLVDTVPLGSGQRPDFKQHDGLFNNVMVVLGMRYLDDNSIAIGMNNVAASNDITDIELRPAIEIAPTNANACRFKVRGYITSYFGARDLERNSQSHASSIVDLNSRLTALEASTTAHEDSVHEHQHADLTGTWKLADNSKTLTITASSSPGIDYDVVKSFANGDPSEDWKFTDNGTHIAAYNATNPSQFSYSVNSAGTIISTQSGNQFVKQ